MGATKRFAEMVIMQMGASSETKFVAVRFGNVLGSRGSVIPIFKNKLKRRASDCHAPSHDKIFYDDTRSIKACYSSWCTSRRKADFCFRHGEPVKIVDLAENLIHLSGYTTDQIPITFTGIRPGEKMYEELLNQHEKHRSKFSRKSISAMPWMEIRMC